MNKDSQKAADSGIFTGFNSTHLKFDVTTGKSRSFYNNNSNTSNENIESQELLATKNNLTKINLSNASTMLNNNNTNNNTNNTERSNTSTKPNKLDPTIEELRNYVELMDKYSLHNFTIYDGKALRETPGYYYSIYYFTT